MKNNTPINVITLLLLLLVSGWSLVAHASSQPIGNIILAVGEVIATDQEGIERKLKRRSKIFTGDTLTTKGGSRCQIRFTDKSLVALTADSQFKVDEYQFNQQQSSDEKAIYSLLKGGMRSISGAIGKNNREDYRLNTPVATIGIRGTSFNIGLIDEDGTPNLYGTVDAGAIVVTNKQGELLLTPGQNFQVAMNQAPRQIMSLPDTFPSHDESAVDEEGDSEDNGNSEENGTADEGDDLGEFSGTEDPEEIVTGGTETPEIPLPGEETDTTPPTDTNIVTETGTLAPAGAAVGFSFIGQNQDGTANKSTIFTNTAPDEFYIDTVSGIGNVPVAGSVNFDTDCNPCSFISATGTLVTGDTGGNPTIGVNWGRWTGSYVVTENGVPDTTSGDFHYIYSPNVTPEATVQTLTGYKYYTLAGGTSPTDQNGDFGTLNSLDMNFDFSNQTVTYIGMSLDIDIGSGTGPITGTYTIDAYSSAIAIPINDLTGSGIKLDATNNITVTSGYVGEIQGTFVGPGLLQGSGEDGIITTYGFRGDTNPSTKAVSGAALLVEIGG